jgi:hypothetical protein
MFVGWDWASTTHDVTVLDDTGTVVDHWALQHTEQDLAAALDRLARLGEPAALPVIIERTSGLVVDRLVAAGHPVVPVHPTAFWAARPRWGASGAKSDAGDSYKLADYLRTDGHRLRRLDRSDPGLQELQAPVRLREDDVPGPHRSQQPARCPAGGALARTQGRVLPAGVTDRARLPGRLPDPPGRRSPRRGTHGQPAAGGTATAAASQRRSCWPGCARPRPPRSASRRPPWQPLSAPRSSCCAPCW